MYPYHGRIRQRINAGELLNYYLTDDYPNIGEALALVFGTKPFLRPIRPERYAQYADVLANYEERRP